MGFRTWKVLSLYFSKTTSFQAEKRVESQSIQRCLKYPKAYYNSQKNDKFELSIDTKNIFIFPY